MTDPDSRPARPPASQDPRTAWALLAVFVPLGGWLLVQIHRKYGLDAPHFWELPRDDPLFGLAMLDFGLTATWTLLVMGERAGWNGWRFWVVVPVFSIVPTVGTIWHILLKGRRPPENP